MFIHVLDWFCELGFKFMNINFVDTVALHEPPSPALGRVQCATRKEFDQLIPVKSDFFNISRHNAIFINGPFECTCHLGIEFNLRVDLLLPKIDGFLLGPAEYFGNCPPTILMFLKHQLPHYGLVIPTVLRYFSVRYSIFDEGLRVIED
jgi:hypothetical protein